MPNPARDSTAGRIYNDLRNLARRTARSTDELMIEYVLERFLFRLAVSPMGGRFFVLKGGLLLAQFGARRMTRDIDILGRFFSGDEDEVVRRISMIAATEVDDGVLFDPSTLKTVPIREDDEYHGLRMTMAASISRARLKLQLDVSFGDPVTPEPMLIEYPQQLDGTSFQLFGYPLATVIAEKLSTTVALGDLNTRDRDYADLHRLISSNDLLGNELADALEATAAYRGITLRSLSSSVTQLPELRQRSYAAWRRRQGSAGAGYPDLFLHVSNWSPSSRTRLSKAERSVERGWLRLGDGSRVHRALSVQLRLLEMEASMGATPTRNSLWEWPRNSGRVVRHDGSVPTSEDRPERIADWLEEKRPDLANMYRAARELLASAAKPGDERTRVSYICHSMREIMNRLPGALGIAGTGSGGPRSSKQVRELPSVAARFPNLNLL